MRLFRKNFTTTPPFGDPEQRSSLAGAMELWPARHNVRRPAVISGRPSNPRPVRAVGADGHASALNSLGAFWGVESVRSGEIAHESLPGPARDFTPSLKKRQLAALRRSRRAPDDCGYPQFIIGAKNGL
jgi:hypothetical protein